MFKRIATGALVFGMVATGPPMASAQSICGTRDHIVANLKERWQEAPNGTGLQTGERVIEVWTSPKSGSWTILVTGANGISCVLASGTDWNAAVRIVAPKDAPASY